MARSRPVGWVHALASMALQPWISHSGCCTSSIWGSEPHQNPQKGIRQQPPWSASSCPGSHCSRTRCSSPCPPPAPLERPPHPLLEACPPLASAAARLRSSPAAAAAARQQQQPPQQQRPRPRSSPAPRQPQQPGTRSHLHTSTPLHLQPLAPPHLHPLSPPHLHPPPTSTPPPVSPPPSQQPGPLTCTPPPSLESWGKVEVCR